MNLSNISAGLESVAVAMKQVEPRMIQSLLQRNPLFRVGLQEHLNQLLRRSADLLPHTVI